MIIQNIQQNAHMFTCKNNKSKTKIVFWFWNWTSFSSSIMCSLYFEWVSTLIHQLQLPATFLQSSLMKSTLQYSRRDVIFYNLKQVRIQNILLENADICSFSFRLKISDDWLFSWKLITKQFLLSLMNSFRAYTKPYSTSGDNNKDIHTYFQHNGSGFPDCLICYIYIISHFFSEV